MFKQSIYKLIIFTSCMFLILIFISFQQTKHVYRDPSTLMNKYYQLKHSNPIAARQALLILLNQDNQYIPAIKEASQWYLYDHNFEKALPLLQRLHHYLPSQEKYTYQLAYAYYQVGQWEKARQLFIQLSQKAVSKIKRAAKEAIISMRSYLLFYQYAATQKKKIVKELPKIIPTSSNFKSHASTIQNSIADNKIASLEKAGYLAIQQNHPCLAIDYFKKIYALNYQPSIAMQLGYLYDQVDNKSLAYRYFKLATKNTEKTLSLRAENALTNLSGQQTKALPAPYFSEIFFNPFSQSRFHLTVRPLVARFGIEQDGSIQTKEYVFFRRTDDNQSKNLGIISQIYEDDVEILGIGGQITPFEGFPLIGFLETGAAYDLVYRNRKPWRADLRSGLMYYNEFGAKPMYLDRITWSNHYYSDLYAEATYFTRYNNNVIGGIKTHQGIRLLQYHSSMLNLYGTGRIIMDTQRQFYNNFAEIGPGLEFIPTNRLNIKFRFEYVNGVYLPAGATPNPYPKYYTNALAQLLFYVKI